MGAENTSAAFSSWPGKSAKRVFALDVPAIHVFSCVCRQDVDARHPSTPRLRRAFSVLGRRSFSEGGKAGHDELRDGLPLAERVKLLNRFNRIARRANHLISCPAPFAKIFRFAPDPNHFYIPCRLVPNEGRIAIVTDAGRDAVDAAASGDVRGWQGGSIKARELTNGTRTNGAFRGRQNRVVLAPVAGVKFAEAKRPDRADKTLIRG